MAQYLNYYDHTIPNDGEETIGMSESERKQIIAERCAKVTFAANFVSSKFQKNYSQSVMLIRSMDSVQWWILPYSKKDFVITLLRILQSLSVVL